MGKFTAGGRVPQSGVYRVYHDSHRLMHEATLLAGDNFPCCKQCGAGVVFELVKRRLDQDVVRFRSGAILEEYSETAHRRKRIA